LERGLVYDPIIPQKGQLGRPETEPLQRVEQPAGAGHDAVPAAVRQMAGEDLEDRAPRSGATVQGGLKHGEFIVVCQQRGGPAVHRCGHRWKTTDKEVAASERGTR